MALYQSSPVRNRLLAALLPSDFAVLQPALEVVPLSLQEVVIESGKPIEHVYFPDSGLVSVMANTVEGRIEVGLIGREGVAGVPVILGADRTPHTYLVQGSGSALRIASDDLRALMRDHPAIFRPLGLYVQAFIVQTAQTAYANASFNIEARLARWVLMTQDRTDSDELVLTHEFLSIMLGVRRPGVTVAIHTLEGFGMIRAKRGRITVLDRQKLMELADDSYGVAETEYDRLMAEV